MRAFLSHHCHFTAGQNQSILSRCRDGFANGLFEFVDANIEGGGDGKHRGFANSSFEFLQVFLGGGFVHFVGDDESGSIQERGVVEFQFAEKVVMVIPGSAAVRGRHVDEQHEDFAAFDMPQKCVTAADVVVGALDETGNISNSQP